MNRKQVEAARQQAADGPRVQKTYYLTREITERLAGAVYWSLPLALARAAEVGDEVDTSDIPDSASAVVEAALWAEVMRLEELFNEGKPFRPAPGKLRTGPGQKGVARLSNTDKKSDTL